MLGYSRTTARRRSSLHRYQSRRLLRACAEVIGTDEPQSLDVSRAIVTKCESAVEEPSHSGPARNTTMLATYGLMPKIATTERATMASAQPAESWAGACVKRSIPRRINRLSQISG